MSSEIPIDPSLEDFSISPSPEPGTQVAELGAGGGQEGDEGGFGGDGEVDARGEDEDYGAPGEEEGEGEGSNKRRRGNNPAGKNGHRPAPRPDDRMKDILDGYFAEGLSSFKDINERLKKDHGEEMAFGSHSSFYRTTQVLGVGGTRKPKITKEELIVEVKKLAEGDDKGAMGYRNMTRQLREQGILVPRDWVYEALKLIDGPGVARRRPRASTDKAGTVPLPDTNLTTDPDPTQVLPLSVPDTLAYFDLSAFAPYPSSSFGPVRRILTSHTPNDTDGSDVTIFDDHLTLNPVLDGNAHVRHLFSHLGVPAISSHSITSSEIDAAAGAVPGVVYPGGVNGQITDVAPYYRIGMHRSNSIDYNIFLSGSATLITPSKDGGGETRTEVGAGEIVIQRGTLHGWEAGPEGARWCTVVVAALPVEKDGRVFAEVDF